MVSLAEIDETPVSEACRYLSILYATVQLDAPNTLVFRSRRQAAVAATVAAGCSCTARGCMTSLVGCTDRLAAKEAVRKVIFCALTVTVECEAIPACLPSSLNTTVAPPTDVVEPMVAERGCRVLAADVRLDADAAVAERGYSVVMNVLAATLDADVMDAEQRRSMAPVPVTVDTAPTLAVRRWSPAYTPTSADAGATVACRV